LLKDWGIIENDTFEKLNQVKQVRNGLAHRWSEREIMYRGLFLFVNFNEFKQDMLAIYRFLVNAPENEQIQNGITFDSIIAQLQELPRRPITSL
jgi:hypothetical protein